MQTREFTLPEWEMVGGESQRRIFELYNSKGQECNLDGGSASISIIDFVNRGGDPYLTKPVELTASSTGNYSIATVTLDPSETLSFSGKYIYQLSFKDMFGNIGIPRHGILQVIKNIDTAFVEG